MKCPSCNLENSDSNLRCIHCGLPLNSGQKVCPNGHYYDSKLNTCPHCPSPELQGLMGATKAFNANTSDLSSFSNTGKTQVSDMLKTKPSGSAFPQSNSSVQNSIDPKKTVIVRKDGSEQMGQQTSRKLVGWLVTFTWKPEGQDFKVYEGRNFIGSSNDAQIKIDDPAISGKHCLLLFRGGKLKIKDELSTNGSYVNGNEIEETEINDGDLIRLGTTELKFRCV